MEIFFIPFLIAPIILSAFPLPSRLYRDVNLYVKHSLIGKTLTYPAIKCVPFPLRITNGVPRTSTVSCRKKLTATELYAVDDAYARDKSDMCSTATIRHPLPVGMCARELVKSTGWILNGAFIAIRESALRSDLFRLLAPLAVLDKLAHIVLNRRPPKSF